MKKTLIIGLLIICHSISGQIPGKKFDGPIVIFDTLTIKKGDVILLGKGSDHKAGKFTYITTPKKELTDTPNKIIGLGTHTEIKNTAQGISNNFSGMAFEIKYFSKVSSKKNGDKILGVIAVGPSYYGKFDLGIYKQAVNFEAAIQAGEIIKINDIDFTKKSSRTIKREITQFVISKNDVQPVVVVFEGIGKNELYEKTLEWVDDYYKNQDDNYITTIENEEVEVVGKKGILISRINGIDLFADLEYRFIIEFMENEIRMNFSSLGEADQNTENVSQEKQDTLDKNAKIQKMSEDVKVQTEQMMNEIASSLVDYLMN